MTAIKVHPAAECFRLMDDEELGALAADIADNGLRDPIVIGRVNGAASDAIVDGRNRLRACEMAGVEPKYETIEFKNDEEVRAFIKSRGERRNVTASQKAMAIALLWPDEGKAGGKGGGGKGGARDAAKKFGSVSHEYIRRARQVLRHSRDLACAVRDGISLDAALEEVHRASSTVDTEKSKRLRLQQEAPDLAELVQKHENAGKGGMPLNEAIAALDERERDLRAIIEEGRRAGEAGMIDFLGNVAALHAAHQSGAVDLIDPKRLKDVLHAAETLKEIMK